MSVVISVVVALRYPLLLLLWLGWLLLLLLWLGWLLLLLVIPCAAYDSGAIDSGPPVDAEQEVEDDDGD